MFRRQAEGLAVYRRMAQRKQAKIKGAAYGAHETKWIKMVSTNSPKVRALRGVRSNTLTDQPRP